jgi:hypothetical protein
MFNHVLRNFLPLCNPGTAIIANLQVMSGDRLSERYLIQSGASRTMLAMEVIKQYTLRHIRMIC